MYIGKKIVLIHSVFSLHIRMVFLMSTVPQFHKEYIVRRIKMKCPIKNLESDCIEKECPLYFSDGCGLRGFLFDASGAMESITESLSAIESKIGEMRDVLYDGMIRR